MRIAVLTSLYPSAPRPREGVFAERRWLGMRARGHEIAVVHPLPHAPRGAGWLARALGSADWDAIQGTPAREQRGGLALEHPRYLHWPGRALGNARRFARRGARACFGGAAPPDVLVADYAWPAALAAHAAAERGIACLISARGSDVLLVREQPPLARALAAALRSAGHACAVSQDLVHALQELGGARVRVTLVPNGVDAQLFRPQARAAARDRLGLAAQGALVLVVGHWIERKDPLLALEAFAAGAPPAARLALIGRGPLEARLRARVRAPDLAQRVQFVGELEPEALAQWYAASDLLLLTSLREGRPNVVLEALASARAVVCTPAGGTAELLAELPECLVEAREPARIGARLAHLLEAPPAEERLRAAALRWSWDASCVALEGCLQAAVAQARGSGPVGARA